MSTKNGKRDKQSSGAPKSRAADWYDAPSFNPYIRPFELTVEQRKGLLVILAKQHLSDEKAKEFFGHVNVAIGTYIWMTEYFKSVKPSTIRSRLRFLQNTLHKILTDKKRGLFNDDDEVTKILLTDALSKNGLAFTSTRKAVLALHNAVVDARFGMPLPNKWKDHAIHALAYRIAVVMRDVVDVEPSHKDTGSFAHLVRETARLAGRLTVSKKTISDAIDLLNSENVLETGEKCGMLNEKPLFKKVPVSDIRPIVRMEPAGKPLYVCTVAADGTVSEDPVRYTKGGEPIYVVDSPKAKTPH